MSWIEVLRAVVALQDDDAVGQVVLVEDLDVAVGEPVPVDVVVLGVEEVVAAEVNGNYEKITSEEMSLTCVYAFDHVIRKAVKISEKESMEKAKTASAADEAFDDPEEATKAKQVKLQKIKNLTIEIQQVENEMNKYKEQLERFDDTMEEEGVGLPTIDEFMSSSGLSGLEDHPDLEFNPAALTEAEHDRLAKAEAAEFAAYQAAL